MVLENNFQTLAMYDAPIFRNIGDYSFIRTLLVDLLKKDKLKFCFSSENTIFSHTIFEQLYIRKALDIIVCGKSLGNSEYYFLDYEHKKYFSQDEKLLAKELKRKIYKITSKP